MDEEELRFPAWQKPLQDLILEFDRERLPEKIQALETLMGDRYQELVETRDGHPEREALNDARTIIRVLKTDRAKS